MIHKIWIPHDVKSCNEWTATRWGRHNERQRVEKILWAYFVNAHVPKVEEKGKRIIYMIMIRKRLLDEDNSVASLKPWIDSLVNLGYLWDDSPKYLELHVEQCKGREQGIEITIEEVRK